MPHPATTADALFRHPRAEVIPAILDANIVIRDVCANLRRSQVTALLGQAEAGMLRLLITDRVAEEIPARLHRLARERTAEAQTLWRERYLPQVRVVTIADHPLPERFAGLVARVADDDEDDVPTAHLALLCAPCVVLTADHDVLAHGFGAPEWLAGLRASGELTVIDSTLWTTARLTELAVEGLGRGFIALGRMLSRNPLALGGVLGVALFAATDGRPAVANASGTARRRLTSAVIHIAGQLQKLDHKRTHLSSRLAPHVLAALKEPTLEAQIAGRLARAPVSLPLARLAEELDADPLQVQQVLRDHPACVLVAGGVWQLGCTSTEDCAGQDWPRLLSANLSGAGALLVPENLVLVRRRAGR